MKSCKVTIKDAKPQVGIFEIVEGQMLIDAEDTQTMGIAVDLTDEEADIVYDYLFRKAARLKDAGLEDSKCYPLLLSVTHKIRRAKGAKKDGI